MFIQKRKIVLKMESKNWLHVCVIALFALFVLTFFIAATSAEGGYSFITKWGSEGTGNGQFYCPQGVAVDSSGDVFVADNGNHRIQKFDSSGTYITKWGSEGTGDGQFYYPRDVAVDSSGDVFVADSGNNRIQKFDSCGGFITKWGSLGTGDGQFKNPIGVAVDSSGDVFVTDTDNHRIQKFDSSGTYITKWGSKGTGDGQFYCHRSVAVDSSGDVFVADSGNHRIQKFDSCGTYITKWGSLGTGDGQFKYPWGVAVDSSGDVFVADSHNSRIQKFDSCGGFITKWGSLGTGDGQFKNPIGVAVDSSGDVFVADASNSRIQKFGEGSAPPHVTGINPDYGYRGETLDDVSITGSDFRDVSMTVELQRGAETIGGTDVLYKSDTEVTCDFDLTGASVGTWDVYLKHNDDDKSSTLDDAFFVHWPAISVSKTASTNGVCPGTDPLAVSIGDTVTYCFNVTNTGDVTLSGITVNDDIYGAVTLGTTTLAPGETTEGTITHTVVGSDAPSVTDTATATGTPPVGAEVTDTDPCTINVAIAPGIKVVKTASLTGTCPGSDPLAVNIGDTVTYCFIVSNTGDVTLTGVTVNDDIYGSVTLGTTTLAPGETTEGTVTHVVVGSDAPSITNTATATGTDPLGGMVNYTDPCTINVALAPDIAITKTANVSSTTVGMVIGYTITVNNTGNVNVTNVQVTDVKLGLSQTIPNLTPGASQTYNPSYTVTQADICAPITNTAIANGTGPCGGAVGPVSASVTVIPMYSAGLSVVKDANVTSATVGTVIGYTINVANTGNVDLTSVLVTDSLTGLSQTIPNLTPGASQTFNPSYTVTQADICAPITNTATANGTDPCGGAVGPESASVSVPTSFSPSLAITKTANVSSATVGMVIGYTINVANTGNVNLISVLVTDSLTGLSETIPTLAPGATQTFNTIYIVTESDICAPISNTATASGTDPCGGALEASASFSLDPTYNADLSLVKTASLTGSCPGFDPLAVNLGDTVTYCFNVTNTGDVTLTSVTVNDDLYGPVTLGTTTLAPGETTGGTITHVVVESDAPSVTNTATANGTDPCSGAVTDIDDCTIDVAIAPGIKVNKTATLTGTCPGSDPLAVNIGDTVTYCFNVTNTGDDTLTSVTVNDDIYGPVTLGTTALAPGETTEGTVTHVVVVSDAPSVTNTATATGTDPLGGSVTDTDPCTINVALAPGIAVVKTASLTGSCPGSDPLAVSIGDTVTYCFNVSNTGDVTLTSVTVNDDIYGLVTLGTTTLAPGETTEGTITHIVVGSDAPSVTDTATATGTPPVGAEVTDTDPCTINVVLATIEITSVPPLGTPPTIEVGQSVVFTAEGKDKDGNTVPIPDPQWFSDGVHGTIVVDPDDPNKCTYTATNEGADYIQCCDGPPGTGIHGSLDFTVVDGGTPVPTSVVMTPETVTITKGDSVEFTVTVFDQNNEEMPDEPVTFTAEGGTITPEGVYTGNEVGEHTITVKVTNDPTIVDTSTVTVDPVTSVPTSVVMTPETVTITKGDSVEFTVTVFDQNNEEMPDEPVTFTAEGGTITPEGVYTGNEVGEHTITVKVTNDPTIVDTSTVTVDPVTSVPTSVVMTPETVTITKGDSVEFTVTVFDQNNEEMPDEPVTFTAEGGTITPEGVYTGNNVGEHTIAVKVTSDPIIVDTSNVNVIPQGTPVETATGTGTAYFATDAGTLDNLAAVNEATLPEEGKPALVFPHGFFSFDITGLTPCTHQKVVVTITLPSAVPVGTQYWKYHASEGGWIQIPMGSDDGDAEITITLEDGGLGDDDGVCNGVIVDSGGPGVGAPKPILTKSAPTSVAPGGNITYTILYANVGLVALTNVMITENYPGGVTFISADPAPDAGTNNKWTIGTLPAGASGQITIKVKAPDSRDLTFTECGSVTGEGFVMVSKDLSTKQKQYTLKNEVTLSCAELPPISAYATTNVTITPEIEVNKTASLTASCPGSDPLAVSIGDTVTYCFNVINTGDVTLTSVMVVDDIYGPVTLATTTLAPGETTEGTLTHVVTESDVPSVTNIATVNATDIDNNRVSDTDDCTINVEPSPCFIATAAYGTALHEDINVLREFRDKYLVTNPAGRVFVKIYYTTSPPVAALIRNNEGLSTSVREGFVKPLVYITRRFVKGGGQNG